MVFSVFTACLCLSVFYVCERKLAGIMDCIIASCVLADSLAFDARMPSSNPTLRVSKDVFVP